MIRLDDPRLITLLSVGIASALLWWMLAASMGDMPMPTNLSIGTFTGTSIMWIIMMLAMMLPAMAPVLVQYAKLAAKEARGATLALRVTLFGTGYFALWAVASVLLAAAQLSLARTDAFTQGGTLATPMAAGFLAIAAGLWQFTPIKDVCLTRCRRPLAWLLANWREGMGGAFPMGVRHGAYCVGCCIALMGLMFVFGAMNVAWMAIIAAYFVAEKIVPAAHRWSRIVGALLIAAGLVTLLIGTATAKPAEPPQNPTVASSETLVQCGASVSALTWFYEGVRDAGLFRAQQQIDGLMDMRASLLHEAARRDEGQLDRIKTLERARIAALNDHLNDNGMTAGKAVMALEAEVADCIVLFFERES